MTSRGGRTGRRWQVRMRGRESGARGATRGPSPSLNPGAGPPGRPPRRRPLSHHFLSRPVAHPDIARACADREGYRQTLAILAKRLATPPGPDWRRPYKALLLLDFLLKHGPPAIVAEVAANGPLLDRLAQV